jgi:hypothetical protein
MYLERHPENILGVNSQPNHMYGRHIDIISYNNCKIIIIIIIIIGNTLFDYISGVGVTKKDLIYFGYLWSSALVILYSLDTAISQSLNGNCGQ